MERKQFTWRYWRERWQDRKALSILEHAKFYQYLHGDMDAVHALTGLIIKLKYPPAYPEFIKLPDGCTFWKSPDFQQAEYDGMRSGRFSGARPNPALHHWTRPTEKHRATNMLVQANFADMEARVLAGLLRRVDNAQVLWENKCISTKERLAAVNDVRNQMGLAPLDSLEHVLGFVKDAEFLY